MKKKIIILIHYMKLGGVETSLIVLLCAPGLGKPVLVMRDTTQRSEAVEAGTVKLVGTDYN